MGRGTAKTAPFWKGDIMSIGVGLLVIALGAIFTFAVQDSPSGLDLHVVGVILMTVGGVGLLLRLSGYGPDNGIALLPRWGRKRTRIVEERLYDPMAEDPTVYRPASDGSVDTDLPTTRPVTRNGDRHLEGNGHPVLRHEEVRYED
jgi:Domain of unknown function (DUF6458)